MPSVGSTGSKGRQKGLELNAKHFVICPVGEHLISKEFLYEKRARESHMFAYVGEEYTYVQQIQGPYEAICTHEVQVWTPQIGSSCKV